MPILPPATYPVRSVIAAGAFLVVILLAAVGMPAPATQTEPTAAAPRTPCNACHEEATATRVGDDPKNYLNAKAALSKQAWAKNIHLSFRCGGCHLVPEPELLERESWSEAMQHMMTVLRDRKMANYSDSVWLEVLHYYYTFSPQHQPQLAPDPKASPIAFSAQPIGQAIDTSSRPAIGHVQVVDLDRNGQNDVLVCDAGGELLSWIHRVGTAWREDTIAQLPNPSHATVFDFNGDGALDIAVGCIGSMSPTDAPVGTVGLLINDGAMSFKGKVILDSVGRIADVQPGDIDGDGDTDFSVADFGYLNRGGIGWLEQTEPGKFRYHSLTRKAGAINVPLADLNRDGRLEIVAVTAQEYEEVAVFLNGKKGFKETIIAKAPTPSYGSSGIQLVDMDRDGDLDILYSNGDNLDLPTIVVRPYHGVQWLENKGKLKFVAHDLLRYYGAYRAEATDLDGDGDTDVVASSLFNDWSDPHRASLIWLENNGKQKFTGHGIATAPTHLLTIAIGDLNNDRLPDIVGGGMHLFPPYDRLGRVTLWRNAGYNSRPGKR
ncbi:MAG: VCBS repeat-containing protein [Chlorobi bacterium CHB2]|nr:VCBS repeat-containing protein [Chlorobi bacterium CHB2]